MESHLRKTNDGGGQGHRPASWRFASGSQVPTCARCINRRFTSLCLFAYHPPSRPRALLMAEWMIAFVWGRARCRGQAHDCVICARQLFGDNTVLPHYESHTVNLTVRLQRGLNAMSHDISRNQAIAIRYLASATSHRDKRLFSPNTRTQGILPNVVRATHY